MPPKKNRLRRRPRNLARTLAIALLAILSFVAAGVVVASVFLGNSREEVSLLILYEQFDALFEQERYVEAIILADEMIERNPRNATSYTNRGLAKSMLGRHHEAIIDYGKTIELRPTPDVLENILITAYYNRGSAYFDWGKIDEARADWVRALELAKEEGDQAWISRLEETLKLYAPPE